MADMGPPPEDGRVHIALPVRPGYWRIIPKKLGMDELPLTHRPHDDIIRHCINRAAELGIWTPPEGWKPYEIPEEIKIRIEKARSIPKRKL